MSLTVSMDRYSNTVRGPGILYKESVKTRVFPNYQRKSIQCTIPTLRPYVDQTVRND